jgi:MFS family permease
MMAKFEYKHYLLILLTIVATFNYVDRYVLSLAMESIKQEFQLSDSQLGFLTGFGFAAFYAVAGIPIARWADRGNRNIIVTLTTGLWSAMVALCALAGNFTQLLLIRVGVAVGEAGCTPPANSLIADYFERAERPRAMAIYWLCGPLAVVIGYLGGGWLIEYFGWRMAFIIVGLPGILLALLVKSTLREPRLKQSARIVESQPSFKDVLVTLWRRQTLRYIVVAFTVNYFFGLGFAQWVPTFLIRSYGMEVGEVGTWTALIWGGFGFVGIYLGGYLAHRYALCKEALQLRCCAATFVVAGFFYLGAFLSINPYQAIAFMSVAAVIGTLGSGPVFSAIQTLVDDQMRSITLAVIFLLANFIGLGLGPLAVGALSDLLAYAIGQESLRYALAAFVPGYAWVSFYYWKAAKTIEVDIRRVEGRLPPCLTEQANSLSEVTSDSKNKAQAASIYNH